MSSLVGFFRRLHRQWAAWRWRRLFPESQVVVDILEDTIRCTWPGKEPETINRETLQRVAIETTDDGPFSCDVFWILEDTDGTRLVVPKRATGEDELVNYVLNLDGFDHMLMVIAMGSTSNQVFECWTA